MIMNLKLLLIDGQLIGKQFTRFSPSKTPCLSCISSQCFIDGQLITGPRNDHLSEWQSFRTRQSRDLELTTAGHTYTKPGRYTIAVKVIDIFGNDTMTLVPVTVG